MRRTVIRFITTLIINCKFGKIHFMLSKEKMIETLKGLPEEKFYSVDTLIEEIILMDKIEKSLEAVQRGEVLSEEEVDKEIEKW